MSYQQSQIMRKCDIDYKIGHTYHSHIVIWQKEEYRRF